MFMLRVLIGTLLLALHSIGGIAFSASRRRLSTFSRRTSVLVMQVTDDSVASESEGQSLDQPSRRQVVGNVMLAGISLTSNILPASAKGTKPDAAFAGLLQAREELVTFAKEYLVKNKNDYEGMQTYLEESANLNAYEQNAGALLESKRLDAESKKEIGTIRRYGVGADVIIMYGGLKAAVENEDGGEAQKYWSRTLDSLEEVISICRGNGF